MKTELDERLGTLFPRKAWTASLAALWGVAAGGALLVPGVEADAASREAVASGRGTNVVDTSRLVSRSSTGDLPNGPSRNAVVSQDERIGRVVAFESDASDLVGADSNGMTDVFLVNRRSGYGQNGDDWFPGSTELISSAPGGGPANGASYEPAVSGDPRGAPTCVAFLSRASNLVPGDTNGKADAFVHDLRTRRTVRVSVDSGGRQANGDSFEVSVNGDCSRVAFSSAATNLALTRARKPGQKVAVTSRPRTGTRQVYVRVLKRPPGRERDLNKTTFLASASSAKRAGNGISYEPAFATQAGKALAFTSTSSNLARPDRAKGPDIFERLMPNGASAARYRTVLVSMTSRGRPGNGPSSAPAINGNGREISYQTSASNILPGDANGFSDIVRADFNRGARPRVKYVSRSAQDGPGNGPSFKPAMTDAGGFVVFESDASNYDPARGATADANGVRDIFLWTEIREIVFLESQGSAPNQDALKLESRNPVTSARGNYLLFDTRDPFVDLELVRSRHPEWEQMRAEIEAQAAAEPRFQQVYLRYLGPK